MSNTEFTPPKDLDEALRRREELTDEIQDIQAQLADKNKTDQDGNRLSSKEYWSWRNSAQYALNKKLSEQRKIKRWIHQERERNGYPQEEQGLEIQAVSHLAQIHKICETLRREDVDFDVDEIAKIDAAGGFLRRIGATKR